ncbi:hypothetical protein CRG98_013783 [Punica granatum]|uniref:C3H1-type domain-containing protein n=1 Tax=Punica granatum TaxID=22663 RepID=A0A2I0KBB8_PUNGR|nr:hypothetical protein CRG98_013783 [Punica granatum]
MMLGERHRPPDTTAYDSPWLLPDDTTDEILPPYSPDRLHDIISALQLYGRAGHDGGDPAEECDEFRMYEFKVRRCSRGRAHDWTECPYAHPGEKARRRDPRRHHYSAAACPDFRKGGCRKGDSCEFSHGVFECWLHPARNLQLDRVKSLPRSYNFSGSGYGSPRRSMLRPGIQSLPSTPTGGIGQAGYSECCWETGSEDEMAMERVESGRSLRTKMFEKLSQENSLGLGDPDPSPDVGWVSELVK